MAPLIPGELIPETGAPEASTGHRLRLADTNLILEVERDLSADATGQRQSSRAAGAVDTVIRQALILDWWGIVKADVGLRNGRIVAIGTAGKDIPMGPGTEAITGEGHILTAGCIDAHGHGLSPQQIETALARGVTTLMGGGSGSGVFQLARLLQAAEALPVNLGFYGKGNASTPEAIEEQIRAGACGLKLHQPWGATAEVLDCCLTLADRFDVQVCSDGNTLQGAGSVEDTIRAINGRTIHNFLTEGAGNGPGPEILQVCGEANVLPSSSTHRRDTLAAVDILHDIGALAILASDSQAMAPVGEVLSRTFQAAHRMKVQRGALPEDSARNDNTRLKRYIAKTTINPAIAHGIDHQVGSVEVGKLADLVLWKPGFFGVKPELVLKGGSPVHGRPMFASFGKALAPSCLTFVSQAALECDIPRQLGLSRTCVPVLNTRGGIGKAAMKNNTALPRLAVDPQTAAVFADGELLTCEPATVLPMAQRYFLL